MSPADKTPSQMHTHRQLTAGPAVCLFCQPDDENRPNFRNVLYSSSVQKPRNTQEQNYDPKAVISRKTRVWIVPDFLYSAMNKLLAVNEAQFLDIILSGAPVRIHWGLAGIVTQVSVITPQNLNVRIIYRRLRVSAEQVG